MDVLAEVVFHFFGLAEADRPPETLEAEDELVRVEEGDVGDSCRVSVYLADGV